MIKKQTKLMLGDNMESLKKIPDNSIDSCVTDGPYGLSFMGKKWDYDVPSVQFWKEVLRVLKPGGHVLSFGGTRTYHRMVVNIEDAGLEIRDQVQWLYGSGFPKSRNIGKDIEKVNVGGLSNLKQVGTKKGTVATNHHELAKGEKPKGFSYKTASHSVSHSEVATARTQTTGDIPVYEINNEWEGWGTALKPANEPICVARKPLSEKTIADNVIKWGTGGINIDGCRVGSESVIINKQTKENISGNFVKSVEGKWDGESVVSEGRFPANIILDETAAELLDEQSGVSESKGPLKYDLDEAPNQENQTKLTKNIKSGVHFADKGGASRFFYVAKVSKKERNLGLDGFDEKMASKTLTPLNREEFIKAKNTHPTVKPINLLTYLVRLVTPEGGIVLDPFMGSGSTGISALLEGFRFVGMEMDGDYFKIAEARIESYEKYRELLK